MLKLWTTDVSIGFCLSHLCAHVPNGTQAQTAKCRLSAVLNTTVDSISVC